MSDTARLWRRLAAVRCLSIVAEGASGGKMAGEGTVEVVREEPNVIVFRERGVWHNGPGTTFRNVYRWTREAEGTSIRLEHLRFGAAQPVALVVLVPEGPGRWRAAAPHVCGADRYDADVALTDEGVVLRWRIAGPRKGQEVEARYG